VSEQFELFAHDAAAAPEGLRYVDDFVSREMEQYLVQHVAALPLQPFQFGQYEGKRRIALFGYRYEYTPPKMWEAEPIPDWLVGIAAKVEKFSGRGTKIAQVLCTEYEVGVGIGWHRDRPHFDRIFGLSLGSACRFRFRRRSQSKFERFTFQAQPRSLYMMAGDARSLWEHSIPGVDALRYSITFRTMTA
jgi:alkylated DNA repair dioxygenase AlkB